MLKIYIHQFDSRTLNWYIVYDKYVKFKKLKLIDNKWEVHNGYSYDFEIKHWDNIYNKLKEVLQEV